MPIEKKFCDQCVAASGFHQATNMGPSIKREGSRHIFWVGHNENTAAGASQQIRVHISI